MEPEEERPRSSEEYVVILSDSESPPSKRQEGIEQEWDERIVVERVKPRYLEEEEDDRLKQEKKIHNAVEMMH